MTYKTKSVKCYESQIYIGNINETTRQAFTQEDIEKFIAQAQDEWEYIIPVRVSETVFVAGSEYKEKGWEISAISYPRLNLEWTEISKFMNHLASLLLENFKQRRVSVVDNYHIVMLESDYFFKENVI